MMQYSEDLLGRQNPDGGWGYRRGNSWTEPTCYTILALAANGKGQMPEVRRGVEWLGQCQRRDGGFAPCDGVEESTWLTALTLLLPASLDGVDRKKAGNWILKQTGRESGWLNRLRFWMLGVDTGGESVSFEGWAWYPGTSAWVGPTAISILALQRLAKSTNANQSGDLQKRIDQGRKFLLARRCRDGGWNHGSTRALGYDSDSYPEMTGLALLALHGLGGPEVTVALARAQQQLAACYSSEAASWLRLGISAHGGTLPASAGARAMAPRSERTEPQATETTRTINPGSNLASDNHVNSLQMHGGVIEISLAALADAAQAGRNPFLAS